MLPVFDFWQYWRNTEDADVGRFLKLFTTLPIAEIAKLELLEGVELNEAKKVLATEVTSLVHGRLLAEQAAETARKTFEEGTTASDLPSVSVPVSELNAGTGLLGLMVLAGLAGSNGEARRHIKGGAVKVNDTTVQDKSLIIDSSFLNEQNLVKLSFGKKKNVLVRPQ